MGRGLSFTPYASGSFSAVVHWHIVLVNVCSSLRGYERRGSMERYTYTSMTRVRGCDISSLVDVEQAGRGLETRVSSVILLQRLTGRAMCDCLCM